VVVEFAPDALPARVHCKHRICSFISQQIDRGPSSASSFRGAAGAGTKHEIDLCMIMLVLAIAMVPIIAYGFWLASELGLY
jgi:hypothetical protein